jgi:Phosphatidylinositol 3- and 4-kinase.
MSRDERALHAGLNDPAVPVALASGQIEILGLMPRSSNYTFLASARGEDGEPDVLAIYKPRRGEIPLWDFPEGTLCQREVAAYVVSQWLGWPFVPPTVLRDGPEGIGSAQLFVEFDPEEHYFTLQETHVDAFRDVALFDAVVNNADRKAGHCLRARDGRIFLIDHGVCFNEDAKLRTVIWEYLGEPIPEGRLNDLHRLSLALGGPDEALRSDLGALLSDAEIGATRARVDSLQVSGRFPEPGAERPYPWPPI